MRMRKFGLVVLVTSALAGCYGYGYGYPNGPGFFNGAAIGATAGAIGGAIVGRPGAGAAAGAVAGALIGGGQPRRFRGVRPGYYVVPRRGGRAVQRGRRFRRR